MNGPKPKKLAASRKARGTRVVPLVVPHGGGDASSDFESAFETLQGNDRARDLWHREPVKIPLGRTS